MQSDTAGREATVTVKIHGQTRSVTITTETMSAEEFVRQFRDFFGIPDNATVLTNGKVAEEVKAGDEVTFQQRASSKAA